MMILEKYKLPINWSSIYYGIKNNYISLIESIKLINANSNKLNCGEELLIDLNVNEEDKEYIQEKLNLLSNSESINAEKIWQLAFLLEIKNMSIPENEKLEKIGDLWADFNYPDSWKNFIYYMPNLNNIKPYDNFKSYIIKEKKNLNHYQ